ncbi:GIY-YIG nuclease family protein [Solilutibacter silvestris]|uniref:GIY-YIG nuclease family protein n=1 Tax=Solilutibacter silvestris TaxID=1645665 RepID=UPI000CA03C9A|nr:GIY-YIG nuclease family protein [Lysobacter silvestris]
MGTNDLWYAYLIRCETNRLYAGVSCDVVARYKQHKSGHGALFTRLFTPIELIGAIPVGSRTYAQRFEKQVKAWKPRRKLQLFEQFGLVNSQQGDDEIDRVHSIVDLKFREIRLDCHLVLFVSAFAHMPLDSAYAVLEIDPTLFEEIVVRSQKFTALIQAAFHLNSPYSHTHDAHARIT